MRTIKFRGKRLDNGEWAYGQYASREGGSEHYIIQSLEHIDGWEWNAKADYVDPKTVGQFTGLIDSNEKEIYEGDNVVQYNHDARTTCKGIVHFDMFHLQWQIGESGERLYTYHNPQVFGTIYDQIEEVDLGEMIGVWIEHKGSLNTDTPRQDIVDFYSKVS